MDDGGFADLRELHRKLAVAVAAAYGWAASIAQDADELVARLTELNRRIVTSDIHYNPFNRADVTLFARSMLRSRRLHPRFLHSTSF